MAARMAHVAAMVGDLFGASEEDEMQYMTIHEVDDTNIDDAKFWRDEFIERSNNGDRKHAEDLKLLHAAIGRYEASKAAAGLTGAAVSSLKNAVVADEVALAAFNAKKASGHVTNSDLIAGKKILNKIRDQKMRLAMYEFNEERQRVMEEHESKRSAQLMDVRRSQKLVVCFLVDCTSSMSPVLEAVRKNIIWVARMYDKMYACGSLKLAFVGYRDFADEKRFEVKQFTGYLDEFVAFVSEVRASGGDDFCEDMAGGLEQAANLQWTIDGMKSTKVLIHVADAPAHGFCPDHLLSKEGADKHRGRAPAGSHEGRPNTNDVAPSLRNLYTIGIKYFFFKADCHGSSWGWTADNMISKFDAMVSKKPGQKDWIKLENSCNLGVFADKVLATLTDSVVATASETAKADVNKKRSTARASILCGGLEPVKEEPLSAPTTACSTAKSTARPTEVVTFATGPWDSDSARVIHATLNKVPVPQNIAALQNVSTRPSAQVTLAATIKMNPLPFATGEERAAHHGQYWSKGRWQNVILKRYFKEHTFEEYMEACLMQRICKELADQFNVHEMEEGRGSVAVTMLDMAVITLDDGTLWHMERRLPTQNNAGEKLEFMKFNNNVGDWAVPRLSESLVRFALFTYRATGTRMMVGDLQGVQTENEITLTDPVLLTNNLDDFSSFGTNWGQAGIHSYHEMSNGYFQQKAWEKGYYTISM